mmetsp:Transcript_7863/g.15014  ORF Transcript_7863/g.15014 Transcript_7863/m.15014 type:complete len:1018 (-) Transcript_7863:254-3307(-)|eukprot:CAMPEP_0175144868 /NCGR_PEP_ID=MMETSP0087-20121206/14414_1 /TAXON_ID=136419 /ORGANISM="Unknown Unknown, Strain D1" /LENGTH=1017 /DNA_ID=CAMNT_0016429471 /DNA_START=38 /DNA_END=3091 /DNA_ORIENTATION=-
MSSRKKPAALAVFSPSGKKPAPPEEIEGEVPEICDILRDALAYTRVGNAVPKKVIYALKPSASLATCMHLFAEKRILAAPVYVVETTEDDFYDDEDGVWTEMVGTETKCIALVNQIDLIHYINSLSLSKQAKLAQMRLGDVIEWQNFDRDISVPIRASLFKLMWFFSRSTSKALLSDNAQACGVISQADINCYLADMFEDNASLALHSVSSTTIEDAGFGKDAFGTVRGDVSVVEAIDVLFKDRVGCLAVLDADGSLMGEFSPRDLRGVGPNSFYRLKGKLVNYLATFCPSSLKPITVTMDTTVGDTCRILADSDKHMLWVTDGRYSPTTCITLADVMRLARRGAELSSAKNLQTPRSQWSTIQSPSCATPGPSFDDESDGAAEEEEPTATTLRAELGGEADESEEEEDTDNGGDSDEEAASEDSDYNPNLVSEKDLPRLAGQQLNENNTAVVTPREIQEAIWIPTEESDQEGSDQEGGIEEARRQGDGVGDDDDGGSQLRSDAHNYAVSSARAAFDSGGDPNKAYDLALQHFNGAVEEHMEREAEQEAVHEEAMEYAADQADSAQQTGHDPDQAFDLAYQAYTEAVEEEKEIQRQEEEEEGIKQFVHQEAAAFAEEKAHEAAAHGLDQEEAYHEAYNRYQDIAARELAESEIAANDQLNGEEEEEDMDRSFEADLREYEEELALQQQEAEDRALYDTDPEAYFRMVEQRELQLREEEEQDFYQEMERQRQFEEQELQFQEQEARARQFAEEEERAWQAYQDQLEAEHAWEEEEAEEERNAELADYQQLSAEQQAYEDAMQEQQRQQNAYEQALYEQDPEGFMEALKVAEEEQELAQQQEFEEETEQMYQQHLEDQYDEAMQREAYEQAMAEEAAYEDDEVMAAAQPKMSDFEEAVYTNHMLRQQEAEQTQELEAAGYVRRQDAGFEYQPTPEEAIQLSPEEQAEVAVSKFEATYVLLKAIRNLNIAGHLSPGQKSYLKNLTVSQDPLMIDSALRYLHTRDDQDLYTTLLETAHETE